jgi:hypothetical protein
VPSILNVKGYFIVRDLLAPPKDIYKNKYVNRKLATNGRGGGDNSVPRVPVIGSQIILIYHDVIF